MNILFISSKYHPHVGGVQTQMRTVAHELACRHRVDVVTLNSGQESYVDGAIAVHPIQPLAPDHWGMLLRHVIPLRNARSSFTHQIYRSAYLPKLRPLVRGKHVVHALKGGFLSRVAEEAARAEGVPFVLTPYFHPSANSRSAAKQRAEAVFWNRADVVFALLETDRQMLTQLGVAKERISLAGVMPLLPETSDPHGFRVRYGIGKKPVVLFLGRIIEYKGAKVLLDAAPLVWREMPDVQFVFAGPAEEAGQSWFAERRDERIRYLGLVDEQEKGDALAACDLFCMPSSAEILPAVYLEAWSYGKAVIGGPAHGLRELIEDNGAGISVKQERELLAARLVELLRNEPLRRRMGARGHELVTRRFSKAALVRTLEETYERLHQRSANRPFSGEKSQAEVACQSFSA